MSNKPRIPTSAYTRIQDLWYRAFIQDASPSAVKNVYYDCKGDLNRLEKAFNPLPEDPRELFSRLRKPLQPLQKKEEIKPKEKCIAEMSEEEYAQMKARMAKWNELKRGVGRKLRVNKDEESS